MLQIVVRFLKKYKKNKYMKKIIENDKINNLIFLVLTITLTFVYVWAVSNETMPMAEGWYTYYAQCMHRGELPYRDFEFLFPPVYLYCIFIITQIFGYKIMVLRLFGVLLFVFISIGVYKVIQLIVGKKKNWIAFVASVASVFYMQSENAQVFYDYVRLMDLFVVIITYFTLRYIKGVLDDREEVGWLYTTGGVTAILIFTKQNTGLIILAYTICLLFFTFFYKNYNLKKIIFRIIQLLAPVVGISAIIFVIMALNGMLVPFINSIGGDAISAKGGIVAALFGWIPNNAEAFRTELFITIIWVLLLVQIASIKITERNSKIIEQITPILFGVITFLMIIVALRSEQFAKNNLFNFIVSPYKIFLVVFTMFIGLGIKILLYHIKGENVDQFQYLAFSLAGMYFAISYASGTCGGLANGQATLGVAFIIFWLLYYISKNGFVWAGIAELLLISVFCVQTVSLKLVNTYYWWEMRTASHWENTVQCSVPLLKGIYISQDESKLYDNIYQIVSKETEETENIYCFPNIPIIYSMCDRIDPGVKSKVQWFDVSTDDTLREDIFVISNNPPKAIIIYNTPDGAYDAHEKLFRNGKISGTREMRNYLTKLVNEKYVCAGVFNAYTNSVSVYIRQ